MDGSKPTVPYGYCHCGCGEKATVATKTAKRNGHVVGEPVKYRQGHGRRGKASDLSSTLWDKIDQGGPDECWPWRAFRNADGYGIVWDASRGRTVGAHRAVYEIARSSKLPDKAGDERVCHSCDNPPCCNPAHLFLSTQAGNVADMVSKGRRADTHGAGNPRAKLTSTQVASIRSEYQRGHARALAGRYGVSEGHIRKVAGGRVWSSST